MAFLTALKPYTEKGQTEVPEWPTQNRSGKAKSLVATVRELLIFYRSGASPGTGSSNHSQAEPLKIMSTPLDFLCLPLAAKVVTLVHRLGQGTCKQPQNGYQVTSGPTSIFLFVPDS